MDQIICRNLTVGYGGKAVLRGLDLCVPAGDYLCIVGKNGSGKTTLMRTLLGLQPPLDGVLAYGGGLDSRRIGYLPQQTEMQRDFPASVREVVLSGFQGQCGWRPFYTKRQKEQATACLRRMGLGNMQDRCYRTLSGGQQQRVLLARALCAADRALVLDEPVTGLDPQAAARMYDQVDALNRRGMTVLMVTHDLSAALRYGRHILHIGRTVFYGTRDEYCRHMAGREGGGAA